MLDVSRKVVPDKGRLNREQLVTKALKFPSCTRKSLFLFLSSSELERRERLGMYAGRHDGKVLSVTRKTKVAILKIILSLTGSQ